LQPVPEEYLIHTGLLGRAQVLVEPWPTLVPPWKWILNNRRALSDGEGPGEPTAEGGKDCSAASHTALPPRWSSFETGEQTARQTRCGGSQRQRSRGEERELKEGKMGQRAWDKRDQFSILSTGKLENIQSDAMGERVSLFIYTVFSS